MSLGGHGRVPLEGSTCRRSLPMERGSLSLGAQDHRHRRARRGPPDRGRPRRGHRRSGRARRRRALGDRAVRADRRSSARRCCSWSQPMVAKMLLPSLGGTPSVWNTVDGVLPDRARRRATGSPTPAARLLTPTHAAGRPDGRARLPRSPPCRSPCPAGGDPPVEGSPALWLLAVLALDGRRAVPDAVDRQPHAPALVRHRPGHRTAATRTSSTPPATPAASSPCSPTPC